VNVRTSDFCTLASRFSLRLLLSSVASVVGSCRFRGPPGWPSARQHRHTQPLLHQPITNDFGLGFAATSTAKP